MKTQDGTTDVRYTWRLLRAGRFRLDAGSMFGLVPRAVWSRTVPTDERGRMQVQHNCLLLERATPAGVSGGPGGLGGSGGAVRALIETGTGDKMDARSRDIFELEDRSITDALAEVGCPPESIGHVLVTHLHFDHAGGLTRKVRDGESADWAPEGAAGTSAGPGVKRTFPNARVHVQAREWADALANRSVMTRTYFRDHLEPIGGQLSLVDSPRPFVPGYTPDRGEAPPLPLEYRMTEAPGLPGVYVFLCPGHTWGRRTAWGTTWSRTRAW